MKVRNTFDIEHTGTLGDEGRVLMSFDQDSIGHIYSLLMDLYSNKELAVIREYSTNAWDSHIAAGITDPIEISLPTQFNAVFVVKDHGVGMSVDDINNHFSKYGWSSKRDNDDEVGMLGLGCKSGLTYTSQFTLVVVKDGVKATVLVTRDDSGVGAVQVVDSCTTDEGNGVEVQIPVRSGICEFNETARKFFWFWNAGSVLIDGEEPDQWHTDSENDVVVDDDIILSASLTEDYVVMGNVAYPVGERLTQGDCGYYNAAVRVPVGSVDFTPSREALMYTDHTEETLATAQKYIHENLYRIAQEDIDAAESHPEAWARSRRWNEVCRQASFTYKGDVIPSRATDPTCIETLAWDDNGSHRDRDRASVLRGGVDISRVEFIINVTGRRGNGVPSAIKQAASKWRKDSEVLRRRFIFSYEAIGGPWVEIPTVTWDTLREIAKAEGYTAVGVKNTETFKVLGWNGKIHVVKDLRDAQRGHGRMRRQRHLAGSKTVRKGRVVWMDAGNKRVSRSNLVSNLGQGVLIVLVDKNKVERFRQNHPEILHVRQYVALLAARLSNQLTPLDMWRVENRYEWSSSGFSTLEPDQILDPEVADLIRELGNPDKDDEGRVDRGSQVNAVRRLCYDLDLNGHLYLPQASDASVRIKALKDRYPLVNKRAYSDVFEAAAVDYINLLYTHVHRQEQSQ